MRLDEYFNRQYSAAHYNCWDFVIDVWHDVTGDCIDINRYRGHGVVDYVVQAQRHLVELPAIKDPSIVLFQRHRMVPHVGVYINGRMIHLKEQGGVQYQPLEIVRLGWTVVRYFACPQSI